MNTTTLEIRTDLKDQFDHLAKEGHRSESRTKGGMRKNFVVFVLAVFFGGIANCAYGRLLVLGPEFFLNEAGKPQKITKNFPVHNTDQKFILSVQNLDSGSKEIKARITLNGAIIALPGQFKEGSMITAPVTLRSKNEISVEATSEAAVALMLTIVNMEEEHTLITEIPLLGEVIDFDGFANVSFPSDSFGVNHSVTTTLVPTPFTQYLFEADDSVPRLPYEIRINSGDKQPAWDVELSVRVPDTFIASDYPVQVFIKMHDNPDTPNLHDRFFMQSSGLNVATNMLKTTLPKSAFSKLYGKNGTYEAVITVGLMH